MELLNTFSSFLPANSILIIIAIYFIGNILKQLEFIKDKYILLILLPISIIITCLFYNSFNMATIINGIVVTALSNLVNQIFKQASKNE